MDLTKFTSDDLRALASGDLSKVSTPGLMTLQREQRIEALKKAQPADYDPDSPEYKARMDPTRDMSGTQKFLAGAGQGMTSVVRGVGQLLGVNSQEDIDNAKRLDAPLMKTGAGKAGSITGNVAVALPTAFIPGANTLTGAALVGGGLGFIQPVASDESRLKNTVLGVVSGPLGVMAGRGIAAGYQGAKALIEPFTDAGRKAIAGRTLQRFGVEAGDLAGTSNQPTITGALPTLAEQIPRAEGAAGAARLQDAARSLDPEIAGKFAAREVENNAARVATLQDLAGQGGARDFAEAMRNGTAKQLYGDAFNVKMDFGQLSAAERGEITKLFKVPAIREAMSSAKEIAANQGLNIAKPEGSIEGLHLMKLAMDDAINSAASKTGAASANKAMSIQMARDRLVTFIQRMAPEYGAARAEYAAMSKPLNQMDVAQQLFQKGTAATSDLGGVPRLMPNQYIGQLKNEDALVKAATGRDLGKLSQVLDPEQFQKVIAIGKELDRAAAIGRAGNGPGSATAQRLSSQNILRQILGPTGLPESWAESTLLNTAMRPIQFAYSGVAEPKIQRTLAELLLDPTKAAAAMQAATPAQKKLLGKVLENEALQQAARTALPAAVVAGQR